MIAGFKACRRNSADGRANCRVGREADRNRADHGCVVEPQDAQKCSGGQCHERTRRETGEPPQPEESHGQRDHANGESTDVDVTGCRRKRSRGVHRTARRARGAEKRQGLHQDDDEADAGHEAGDDDMRSVGHEAPDPGNAKKHLQEARHDDDRQGFAQAVCVTGQDHRHGDGHRRGGAGNLRARAAEHRGEEPDRDRSVESCCRAHPRSNTEPEGDRKRHHHRRHATEDVAAQRVRTILHSETTSNLSSIPVLRSTA